MVKLLSNPDNKVILSLLHLVSCEQKESKGFFYLFFFFTTSLQSPMLTVASTGIPWHCQLPESSAHRTVHPLVDSMDRPISSLANGGSSSLPGSELPERNFSSTRFNPKRSQPQEILSRTGSVSWLGAISREAAPRRRSSRQGHLHPSAHLAVSWAPPDHAPC